MGRLCRSSGWGRVPFVRHKLFYAFERHFFGQPKNILWFTIIFLWIKHPKMGKIFLIKTNATLG